MCDYKKEFVAAKKCLDKRLEEFKISEEIRISKENEKKEAAKREAEKIYSHDKKIILPKLLNAFIWDLENIKDERISFNNYYTFTAETNERVVIDAMYEQISELLKSDLENASPEFCNYSIMKYEEEPISVYSSGRPFTVNYKTRVSLQIILTINC